MNKGIDSQSHNGDPVELSETNDLYGYYKSAKMLAKTVEECATPFVVGIYGRWGRGKSTYLNTLKKELDRKEVKSKNYLHNQYSPWNYHLETFNDVWISVISELASGQGSFANSLKTLVKKINLWRVAKTALGVGAELIPGGSLAKKAIDQLPDKEKVDNEYDVFIQAKQRFDKAIEEYLKKNPNGRVFIYIDDIDRCEPKTSVNVLRAVQVLCRTKGCVFLLGLDRDVIVTNLIQVYKDVTFAKEYLDKVVQLHIELPPINLSDVQNALLYKNDGTVRKGIKPFIDWVATFMDFNPRKIERFLYLYDYKLSLVGDAFPDLQTYRQTVLFTAWELRWPELASEIARARGEILDATEKLQQAENEDIELGIVKKYAHLPILQKIQSDRMFLHAFRKIYDIDLDK